ncbi:hypothetical protein ACQKPE_01090 [Pseudomonas sp. NPDC089554]|uniref:hypothetical protein n=1 Tax=Pseudomonas sp. NPDC089554 TaxID=3390653 RepID=UPI003D0309A9
MNDARLMLFQRHENTPHQPLRVHELEARLSDDGRSLVISRYLEQYQPGRPTARREVSHQVPIAALLRWMAKEGG